MDFNTIIENEKIMKTIKYLCWSYYETSIIKYSMEYEDYYQEQLIALYKKLLSYNEEKSSIKTFLEMCIKTNHIDIYRSVSAEKNKINNNQNKFYIDAELSDGHDSHSILKGEDDVSLTMEFFKENYKELLTEEEYKIVDYLIMGYSQIETGKILGFKPQQIKYKIKKIREKMKFLITN